MAEQACEGDMEILGRNGSGQTQSPLWCVSQLVLMLVDPGEAGEIVVAVGT